MESKPHAATRARSRRHGVHWVREQQDRRVTTGRGGAPSGRAVAVAPLSVGRRWRQHDALDGEEAPVDLAERDLDGTQALVEADLVGP